MTTSTIAPPSPTLTHGQRCDDPADNLLPRLDGVEQVAPGEWRALCPVHNDTEPSLDIRRADDGRLLVICRACGANGAQVATKLIMPSSWLFPPRNPAKATRSNGRKPLGKIVNVYPYRDEHGTLLYEALRYEPKDFRPRMPNGKLGLDDGVRRVPYRLPELLAAVTKETVFVVEGEKDSDRLRASGLVATTNVGGAKKLLDEYSEFLRDRHVVVLIDNDESGRLHGEQVAASLQGIAASVKVVLLPGLPPKGDVSDWLDAGGTREVFFAEVNAAPEWVPTEPAAKEAGDGTPKPPPVPPPFGPVANFVEVQDPESESGEPRREPIPMGTIRAHLFSRTDGWPKRVGTSLFVPDTGDDPGVCWLESVPALHGWLGTVTQRPPEFRRGTAFHTASDVFAELCRTSERFDAVEALPHEPPIPGHYYCVTTPEPGDGETLQELLSRFNPASPIDRDLILAFIVTLFWGGPGGCRPVFVISSPDGRGAGKTRLVSMLAQLVGGQIELSPTEDIAALKTRLLSPEALRKRLAVIDNIKSNRFSWGDLEAMVTAPSISGKRLYHGETERPGTITYAITLNGPALSKDMAQRSIIIELAKPQYSGDWEEATRTFINKNRRAIVADVVGFLRGPQRMPSRFSRWGHWEREVLSRLPDPTEAQLVIAERQQTTDADSEEADTIEDHFRIRLAGLGYFPALHAVFIPSRVACQWFAEATGERGGTTTAISRRLRQAISEGAISRLRENGCRSWGRGFVWQGLQYEHDPSDSATFVQTDLTERISEQRSIQNAACD